MFWILVPTCSLLAAPDCAFSALGVFFFSSRRRHTRLVSDWSSDVCSSDLSLPSTSIEAFDAATSRTIWVQQPTRPTLKEATGQSTRGVTYWRSGADTRIIAVRSEERRVGKECRSRRAPADEKKKKEVTTRV